MKRTRDDAKRRRAASTTSTTGPHVRLEHQRGVANVTTNGTCAARDSAIEYRSSPRSGGTRVVNGAVWPCAVARVGVCEGKARVPTAGLDDCSLTTTWVTPPMRTEPCGRASTQYVPALGTRTCATYSAFTGSLVVTPGTPTFSSLATVCPNGLLWRERAIQKRAFGGAITRPRWSTTRKEIRRSPGE